MSDEVKAAKPAVEEGGPNLRAKQAADGSIVFAVENDFEAVVQQISDLLDDEDGKLWSRVGEVVERLAPNITPYDRREAVDEILAPIRMVITDAFW